MANVLLLNGNPTQAGTDGTLVAPGNPVTPDLLLTGVDAESPPIKMAIRTNPGYERAGPSAITPQGTNASKWALAPDSSGIPGVWGAWGAPLVLANLLKNQNLLFWVKARVTSDESYPLLYNDLTVTLSVPDDAYLLTASGKSLPMPYGLANGVSKPLGMLYTIKNIVGRSLDQIYAMSGSVGKSLVMPYSHGGFIGKSNGMPYGVTGAIGKSNGMPYTVKNAIGKSLDQPYTILSSFTTFLDDTFTEASDTTLASHTSDTGGAGWTAHPGADGGPTYPTVYAAQDELYGRAVGNSVFYHTATPGSANQRITGHFIRRGAYNTGQGWRLYARMATTGGAPDAYCLIISNNNASGVTVALYAVYSGAFHALGSTSGAIAMSTSAITQFRLRAVGTSIIAEYSTDGGSNWTQTHNVTDSNVSAVGKCGIAVTDFVGTATNGINLDRLLAEA